MHVQLRPQRHGTDRSRHECVFEPVLAALLNAAEAGRHTSIIAPCDTVLGLEAPGAARLVGLLVDGPVAKSQPGRALDNYMEARVHGSVRPK